VPLRIAQSQTPSQFRDLLIDIISRENEQVTNTQGSVADGRSAIFGVMVLTFFAGLPTAVWGEGSAQIGLNQRLLDFDEALAQGFADDASSASLFVDILAAGEIINISVCGVTNTDDIDIEIFDSAENSVFTQSLTDANVDCGDPLTGLLTNPATFGVTLPGTYRVSLQNTSGSSFGDRFFQRYDVSVTPPGSTDDPDPTVAAGRLWAYSWNFNAGSFDEGSSTDSDFFVLVPGGRSNSKYVWLLDLNNFAGFGYNIVANDIGVDAPNSGYSTNTNGNSVAYKFPVYTGLPAIADPLPSAPPAISGVRFLDNDGVDSGISPGSSVGVQDAGTFEFTSDVTGTYAILIDIDQDGSFGNSGDRLLLGPAVAGPNSVFWDGADANGVPLPVGTYNARISVRMGEYHFVANDAETSGGPIVDGLSIFLSDLVGNVSNTQVYWDDVTVLGAGAGGTSTLPNGELSGTSAGSHTWGDFTGSGFGNIRLIDTYVFGFTTTTTAVTYITSDDIPLTGTDGVVDISNVTPVGGSLGITVTDADLNTDASVVESVAVSVTNGTTGELEQIVG